MTTNRALLDGLFERGQIHLQRSPLFDRPVPPKAASFAWGKVEGMLLGLAIGDSLGNTSESQLPGERRSRYGEIRDYLPHKHLHDVRGYPSDDTQLAFWTLEQLIVDRGLVPEHVAARFCRERIYGIGHAMKEFIANHKAGLPWYESGVASAGNGALMRIAPVLIPHLRTGGADLWADAALCAMVTHNDRASTAACVAFVAMLWELLDMSAPPQPEWWLERYVEVARDLEGETALESQVPYDGYRGPLWRFVQERVGAAYRAHRPVLEAGNAWYSGAFLLETVPSALYILMRHGGDPEEAIVRAVNDTKDNDTVAAIVGAAVGALHGRAALPERWVRGLSGRTGAADDGRVFELIEQARSTFLA